MLPLRTIVNALTVTLASAVPAFMLDRVLFVPAPSVPHPTPEQLPFFVVLKVLEVLTFGAGVAFIAFGLPHVRRATRQLGLAAWPAYAAIGWSLISWWPHDSLHLVNGLDLGGLLVIEYTFHATLFAAGLIMAWYFIATARLQTRETAIRPVRRGPGDAASAA